MERGQGKGLRERGEIRKNWGNWKKAVKGV